MQSSTMPTATDNPAPEPDDAPYLGEDIQCHLGRRLRATYDELLNQPVPDKFRLLLEELARRESEQ